MKEIKTLEDALALVPTHWPLVPDVDKWKEGDKALSKSGQWGDGVRRLDAEIYLAFRRPIPQSVREAEARWILYNSLADVETTGIGYAPKHYSSGRFAGQISFGCEIESGLRKLSDFKIWPEIMGKLGGESAVIQMLTEGPGALWRWIQENRNG